MQRQLFLAARSSLLVWRPIVMCMQQCLGNQAVHNLFFLIKMGNFSFCAVSSMCSTY